VADRRQRVRFEIVGRLPGSITTAAPAEIQNLSRGGALIRSQWPLTVDGMHTVRLGVRDEFTTVQARVRHVRRAQASEQYLIGLEFVDAEPRAAAQLERLVSDSSATPAHQP
jgi:c-di-GMP-binding flagellar brake protein YcgR